MAGEITWKNISAPSFTGAAYLNKLGNDQTNKALGGISKWMGDRVQGGIDNNTNPLLDSIGSVNSLQDLSAMESQMSPEALTGQFGKYVDKGAISSALSKQKGILADKAGANLLSQVNSQIAAGGDSRTIRDNASGMIAKLGNNLTMEQASNLTNAVNGRTASGNKLTDKEIRDKATKDQNDERARQLSNKKLELTHQFTTANIQADAKDLIAAQAKIASDNKFNVDPEYVKANTKQYGGIANYLSRNVANPKGLTNWGILPGFGKEVPGEITKAQLGTMKDYGLSKDDADYLYTVAANMLGYDSPGMTPEDAVGIDSKKLAEQVHDLIPNFNRMTKAKANALTLQNKARKDIDQVNRNYINMLKP